jgi:hypothetical protein
MKGTIKAATAALPFVILANIASAGERVQLSDQQMDGVTAAGSAFADALADAIGAGIAFTETDALAAVEVVDTASSQATTISLVGSLAQASSLSEAQ